MLELQAQRPTTHPFNHPNQGLDNPSPRKTPYEHGITLEYDELPDEPIDDPFDAPNPSSSFREALGRSVAAAESRAKEAESLFGSIASHLDNHWAVLSHDSLPANQRLALKNFCKDLAEVATRHFDAYISGKQVSKIEPTPDPCRTPQAPESLTYAKVARRPQGIHTESMHSSKEPARPSPKTQPQQHRTDDCLFVCIPDDDRLRGLSAYAFQSHLKAKLGNEGRVLVNV
ncbi:BgTH12-01864 [Blumeria graminis f. sp. triticale]|uniref:BgTH12-01864 n=1 Tax=Blumeria graminis f. sp. triticale TaxID=1689686 RepID=A0A9W4DH12_BLUGR|nr:BgTH12-01864 [Blumeria graminis f. sp. triticale]